MLQCHEVCFCQCSEVCYTYRSYPEKLNSNQGILQKGIQSPRSRLYVTLRSTTSLRLYFCGHHTVFKIKVLCYTEVNHHCLRLYFCGYHTVSKIKVLCYTEVNHHCLLLYFCEYHTVYKIKFCITLRLTTTVFYCNCGYHSLQHQGFV